MGSGRGGGVNESRGNTGCKEVAGGAGEEREGAENARQQWKTS